MHPAAAQPGAATPAAVAEGAASAGRVAQDQPVFEQGLARYYARRAAEYERVYAKPERQDALRDLAARLCDLMAGRRVLEVACGTGWWTPHGARQAAAWLATDLNPETLALARLKALPAAVQFATVDAWTWQGLADAPLQPPFDAAFAGCWWSHLALQRLPSWLSSLHAQLLPGARVVFLDNCFVPGSSTPIARQDADGNTYQRRQLEDGSAHEVLKNFPSRSEALACLGPRARHIEWVQTSHFWLLHYEIC